jgi:predicted DNA binding CopG/RHH family protein
MKKITYKDEFEGLNIDDMRVVEDTRLPSPAEIAQMLTTKKVTLSLTPYSISFFKSKATELNIPYQKLIRGVIDSYARQTLGHRSTT